MKKITLIIFLLVNCCIFAQKPCEIDSNITDTLGSYKSTKQFMIFERSFAGNTNNVFFALTNTNGILGIETQLIQSSADFIKANCFNSNSRIFLQLNNGKIVTLLYAGNETCGSLVRNEKNQNIRVISGSFIFSKENFEDLKTSPVTFMRIKFASETVDYPFKTEFKSELDQMHYEPEKYFINYMKCIEN